MCETLSDLSEDKKNNSGDSEQIEKTYEVNYDINFFVIVKAKNEDEAVEKALAVELDKTDGQSEPHNIEVEGD